MSLFSKCADVIISCVTKEQLDVAYKYCELMEKRVSRETSQTLGFIFDQHWRKLTEETPPLSWLKQRYHPYESIAF